MLWMPARVSRLVQKPRDPGLLLVEAALSLQPLPPRPPRPLGAMLAASSLPRVREVRGGGGAQSPRRGGCLPAPDAQGPTSLERPRQRREGRAGPAAASQMSCELTCLFPWHLCGSGLHGEGGARHPAAEREGPPPAAAVCEFPQQASWEGPPSGRRDPRACLGAGRAPGPCSPSTLQSLADSGLPSSFLLQSGLAVEKAGAWLKLGNVYDL